MGWQDKPLSVWIGWDAREAACFAVARNSMTSRLTVPVHVRGLVLQDLIHRGWYRRPHERRVNEHGASQLYDLVSDAPMATEFACSRFFVPLLQGTGWALFTDCDVMARRNLMELFNLADPDKAVMCVPHRHVPASESKMDGQVQTIYSRKNWSSVMLFNCEHPANRERLTPELLNTAPGRDLHRFCWLQDDEIGALPPEWNYLVGHTQLPKGVEPAIVHWTDGAPCMPGYEDAEYAAEFVEELRAWAR